MAGSSVRSVKNCDRGLVNAPFTLWPREAFSSRRSVFHYTDRPGPSLPEVNWLTSGFVYATLSFNRLMRRLQNRFISNHFMLVLSSPQLFFRCEISFLQSTLYYVQKQCVTRCESLENRFYHADDARTHVSTCCIHSTTKKSI